MATARVSSDHANWIGGVWRPAASEHVHEIELACAVGSKATVRERWPRSGEADVAIAIGAATRAACGWQALGSGARTHILESAGRALCADPDPDDRVARRLALTPAELARHHAGLAAIVGTLRPAASAQGRAFAARDPARALGPLLFVPHWSELWCEPVRSLFSALALGHTALWIADGRVPMLAESVACALEDAGLPPGVLALVHDDGETVLRAAIASREIAWIEASGPAARMLRLEHLVFRLRPGDDRLARATAFGAGREERARPPFALRILQNRSHFVGLDVDPKTEARFVVEHAFGRATALSGELHGQVGRVVCDARCFSLFTAALLEELDHDPELAASHAFVETATAVHLRRAGELGLDEGATPIFGFGPRRVAAVAAERGTYRPARADGSLSPLIFTNVEEHMRLAWLGRPAPILCLLRVESEAEGRALAVRLDQDPRAEDLSAEGPDAFREHQGGEGPDEAP